MKSAFEVWDLRTWEPRIEARCAACHRRPASLDAPRSLLLVDTSSDPEIVQQAWDRIELGDVGETSGLLLDHVVGRLRALLPFNFDHRADQGRDLALAAVDQELARRRQVGRGDGLL